MGSSQEYSPTNSNRKPDLFDQAEQAAFRHVVANLCAMPFCSRADLEQAAASYFYAIQRIRCRAPIQGSVRRAQGGDVGGVVVSQTSGPPNTETAHQVHRSASGARAARGLDPEEGRDGLDGLEGTACAGSRRQAGRDRRGTRVQPSHGVQTEQAAISPDRRGGLVLLLRVDTR